MRRRVVFIERRRGPSPSIERVFRSVAENMSRDDFETEFISVPYGDGLVNVVRNLLLFRPPPADIYHVTGHIHYICLRLPKRKTILTIHDLILLHIRTGIRRWVLKKLYLDMPIRRARAVTTISNFSASEIERFAGIGRDHITVIGDPLSKGFEPEPRMQFNAEDPQILHVGTAPNKNLSSLVSAVAGLSCRLRIIGRLDEAILAKLNASGIRFINDEFLEHEQMVEAYRACDIVAFCSTYEGFGLPVIEAQAMEKPVVTSDIEPMRSVAGDGALFVDPERPESIRAGIERLITDAELRRRLTQAGAVNVRRFDPRSVAAAYERLYRSWSDQ